MTHPYRNRPDYVYWDKSVAFPAPDDVDPVTDASFKISPQDKIVTAGSCFAQHISRKLVSLGYGYHVTEPAPVDPSSATNENYGVFSARYGNIYTVRQLLQLFRRAYGLFRPKDNAWQRKDGAWLDPFRPRIQKGGFQTVEQLETDRAHHLRRVRKAFEECNIFVFTLGLTEGWLAAADGAVFPLAPGAVVDEINDAEYRFENFSADSMVADLSQFLDGLRDVNPRAHVILTVSPVPLIATAEDRHVLVSTTVSKAALRLVADIISRTREGASYFPSYEIVTGAHTRGRYFAEDLRSVTEEGVAHVMRLFSRHYLVNGEGTSPAQERGAPAEPTPILDNAESRESRELDGLSRIVCDEEALVQG